MKLIGLFAWFSFSRFFYIERPKRSIRYKYRFNRLENAHVRLEELYDVRGRKTYIFNLYIMQPRCPGWQNITAAKDPNFTYACAASNTCLSAKNIASVNLLIPSAFRSLHRGIIRNQGRRMCSAIVFRVVPLPLRENKMLIDENKSERLPGFELYADARVPLVCKHTWG